MTKVVALTGGIAAGKSTVCAIFAQLGVPIIDTDEIARALVEKGEPAYQKVVEHFGQDILQSNKAINRALLREKIFANPTEKLWLEDLLHPLIRMEVKRRIEAITAPYCIIVVPLLAEKYGEYKDFIDFVMTIEASKEAQIARLMARDNISEALAETMISQQAPSEAREVIADSVILNEMPKAMLQAFIEQLHQSFLQL